MKPDILNYAVRRPGGGTYVTKANAQRLLDHGRIAADDVQMMSHELAYLWDIDLVADPEAAKRREEWQPRFSFRS